MLPTRSRSCRGRCQCYASRCWRASDAVLRMQPDSGEAEIHWTASGQDATRPRDRHGRQLRLRMLSDLFIANADDRGVAQSSAEAELGAIRRGAIKSLFLASVWEEMTSDTLKINIFSDSSAGCAIACRRGLFRVRHLSIRQLFVQQLTNSGRV